LFGRFPCSGKEQHIVGMNDVMTETEAAFYLRRSTKTLQRRRRSGQISFIEDGGIFYLKDDLDAYLAARRKAATAPPPPERKAKYRRTVTKHRANREALLDIL
jgi:hypothetical protein